MSGAQTEDAVSSAVPLVDLTPLDDALRSGGDAVKQVLKRFRPADIGRDLSRRDLDEGKAIFDGRADDRWAGAMLRATHPSVAARLLASSEPQQAGRTLAFLATDHQVAILGALPQAERE